ncbi:hypothetical protein T12_16942 [Trichinella patagoniensis]|uniref:Uncharacterized protein n=1 Tax=Trichinella patagoniensis TaxID=990121 RepID=A0A0V0YZ25_9BILA|nr:hypothetical protein T12_17027 [Trichinella patagoniensis]KRY05559.1 hypothetical protein T12_16942 [Trichinella patagoniensis]
MKENRLAQNNEILHKSRNFQRIPHYNVEKLFYTKIQLSSIEAIYSTRTRFLVVQLSRIY